MLLTKKGSPSSPNNKYTGKNKNWPVTGLRKFHFLFFFFLNIKPYNLCKKQYVTYKSIYIFIYSTSEAYLQFIFTETKRERERQIQTEKKSSKQYIMSNTVVLQLCSQRKNQQEGLLLETCELPTLTSRVWAHTNLFWWLIKFITISVVRSAQTICNKSDLNFTLGNDRVAHLYKYNCSWTFFSSQRFCF